MSPNNSFALDNKLELMRAPNPRLGLIRRTDSRSGKFALSTDEIDLRTGHGPLRQLRSPRALRRLRPHEKAVEGMRFEAGQSLLELANHSQVWIVAQFPEDQAMYVNVGQKMTVTFPSMPQKKVQGEISFIDPHVDDEQRRVMARIVISDEGHMFHPGLFAEVSGEMPLREGLTISAAAVVPTGSKYIVFVDHGGGRLEPRQVEIDLHSGDYDEVVSGLKEGDRIISSANFLIDAESRIQGVLKTWGDRP